MEEGKYSKLINDSLKKSSIDKGSPFLLGLVDELNSRVNAFLSKLQDDQISRAIDLVPYARTPLGEYGL